MTYGSIAELEPYSFPPTSSPAGDIPPAPGTHLAASFQMAARRFAQRTAITYRKQSVSYAELATQAAAVAAGLQQHGLGPGSIVAILLERGPAMIAAMLGIVQAGAAYLPLDTRYPDARIAETLTDAHAGAVITAGTIASATPCLDLTTLLQTREKPHPAQGTPADPAYVIYTSGSTGKPKGVVVTHSNITRLFSATQPWFHFSEQDVWTMFHSFAFDFSVWEIWGALLYGGRLVIVRYETSRAPEEFHDLLARERVTILNQTPSAFSLLDAADTRAAAGALCLRTIIFGGEALCGAQLAAWMSRHGDAAPELINMYGITETTVHVTYRRMHLADAAKHDNLIGRPISDLELHVLDERLEPMPQGSEGELCIGGAGVAAGYLNRPEYTAQRFISNPFGPGRLYRSGDMARRRADGELVYCGRRDGQVKVNGFRIETGEIEAALLAHPAITQACVVARPGPDGALRLLAYYTAIEEVPLSGFLAARLPAQMLPSLYQRVDALALNLNGKIDRSVLPEVNLASTTTTLKTTFEQRIAAIWRRILGVEAIGPDDNFFDTGGTSLLLIAMRAKLEEEFARGIPVTWMFECTTIRAMAARLSTGLEAAPVSTVQANADRQRQAFARAKALSGGAR